MGKTVSRTSKRGVVLALCLSFLLLTGFTFQPSHTLAAGRSISSHTTSPATSCGSPFWDLLSSYQTRGNGYTLEVYSFAQYDAISGAYCGKVAAQAEVYQPPHQPIGTLQAKSWGCGSLRCLLASSSINVQAGLNGKWWSTPLASSSYNAVDGCVFASGFYSPFSSSTYYTNCVYV